MERGRKRSWWSGWLGNKFIVTGLLLQLLMIMYMLQSSSTPGVQKKESDSSLNPHLLFVGIFSQRLDTERRQTLRETWLKFSVPEKVSVKYKFIIGRPMCTINLCDLDILDQEFKISEEAEKYKDVLRVDVLEQSDTRESEMLWETFAWLAENLEFRYFVKAQDDSFLRLDLISREWSRLPIRELYWSGFVWREVPPVFASSESPYNLKYLPPYASRETFFVSSDIVNGLASVRPNVHLKDEGQSMALWLLPFNITPVHDPRFQQRDVCHKQMLAKCNLSSSSIRDLYNNAKYNGDVCERFNTDSCPLCFECEPSQPHWKLNGITCLSSGAILHEKASKELVEPGTSEVLGFLPLLQCERSLLEDTESSANKVRSGRSPNRDHWQFKGNVEIVPVPDAAETSASDSCVQLAVRDVVMDRATYITQEITLNQVVPEALSFSAWSRSIDVDPTEVGDYCLYADFTYADGTRHNAFTVDFDAGTHDWQYNVKIFDPPKPISRITLRCMFRNRTGTVWFNEINVRILADGLCDLKHQSLYFGGFRPASLNMRTHLRNLQIIGGALPREATQGIVGGREGLVNDHIHADEEDGEVDESTKMHNNGTDFVLIWTSPANTFKLRNRRVIESIFFHHPEAHVRVYSNELPFHFFHTFNTAGYDVRVERYDLNILVQDLPGSAWVGELPTWSRGEFYYSHLSDLLRFLLLYRYGGVYTDLDSILLRRIDMENVAVAEFCGSGGCPHFRDNTIKYYLPTGFMAFKANHPLLLEALGYFDTNYDAAVRYCGVLYLSMAYTKFMSSQSASPVKVLTPKAFYPIPEKEIGKYFTQDHSDRWKTITGEAYALHFWGALTHTTPIHASSLMARALDTFSISNLRQSHSRDIIL